MKLATRALAALFLFSFATWAQPVAPLHLTVNYPSASVVVPMFGKLPKDVELIEVMACNDSPTPVLVSSGRIVQSLRRSGIQALSRDAAISTMQRAEDHTWQSLLLRNSNHAMNIVNFLVISKAVSVGPTLGSVLPSIQALMEAIVPELGKDVPDQVTRFWYQG
jgi:hypothetical protein